MSSLHGGPGNRCASGTLCPRSMHAYIIYLLTGPPRQAAPSSAGASCQSTQGHLPLCWGCMHALEDMPSQRQLGFGVPDASPPSLYTGRVPSAGHPVAHALPSPGHAGRVPGAARAGGGPRAGARGSSSLTSLPCSSSLGMIVVRIHSTCAPGPALFSFQVGLEGCSGFDMAGALRHARHEVEPASRLCRLQAAAHASAPAEACRSALAAPRAPCGTAGAGAGHCCDRS